MYGWVDEVYQVFIDLVLIRGYSAGRIVSTNTILVCIAAVVDLNERIVKEMFQNPEEVALDMQYDAKPYTRSALPVSSAAIPASASTSRSSSKEDATSKPLSKCRSELSVKAEPAELSSRERSLRRCGFYSFVLCSCLFLVW